jgi:hypothetical protein
MPEPRIRPLPHEVRDSDKVYEQIRVDHQQLLGDLIKAIKFEAETIEEMINTLHKIETQVNEHKLNLTISKETLMWQVTDAFKRIRQTMDETLAKFFGVSVEDIHRKVDTSGGKQAFTVIIGNEAEGSKANT